MHFNQANSARKELLQTVCTSDILVSPEPPVRYVWEGRCPRGVVTLWGAWWYWEEPGGFDALGRRRDRAPTVWRAH